MRFFSKHDEGQRKHRRIPTFGVVEIEDGNGAVLEEATFRDISISGALIQAARARRLPDEVSLWFPVDRLRTKAKIKWRDSGSIGVEFERLIEIPERLMPRSDRATFIASQFKAA